MRAYNHRGTLRGVELEAECYKAQTISKVAADKNGILHEGIFCYGLIVQQDIAEDCKECPAHIYHAGDWKKDHEG